MVLSVKESVSGRRYDLNENGDEVKVCGGRGSVCLSDDRVALRCCGHTAIVVTRKLKQSVLRPGDVVLLDARDTFYANGTLTKYEVIDTTVASKATATVNQTSANSHSTSAHPNSHTTQQKAADVMQFKRASPSDISASLDSSSSASQPKRTKQIIIDDDSSESETEETPRPSKKTKVIEDSDDENPTPTKSPNWMASYGHGDAKAQSTTPPASLNKPERLSTLTKKRIQSNLTRTKPSTTVRETYGKREAMVDAFGDESSDDESAPRALSATDEVAKLLNDCKIIANRLRTSIEQWGGASESIGDHVSLTSMDQNAKIVTQKDLVGVSESLELKPYQIVGVNWLLLLYQNRVSGVLADEMGLGKTVQAISFLLALPRDIEKPHLVIVPASVLSNWEREFEWIAPKVRIVKYHGTKEDRLDLQESLHSSDFDVMLTTYSYFERDACQDDRAFLRSFRFEYMVLDEGHSIKNAKSSRFKRIANLRAAHRLVLSGTPLQNNLNELLALLSFLMPKVFDHGSDALLTFFQGTHEAKVEQLRQILAPFILRREKRQVLTQLVPKVEKVEMLEPRQDQKEVYDGLIDAVRKQKQEQAQEKLDKKEMKKRRRGESVADRRARKTKELIGNYNGGGKKDMPSDTHMFTQLRKAANHPILLRQEYADDSVLDLMAHYLHRAEAFGTQCSVSQVKKEIESYSDYELHSLCVQYEANKELKQMQLDPSKLLQSSKFDYLQTLLPTLKKDGHRVLLFSQWTKMLDLMELLMQHLDMSFVRLDGGTNVAERQELIDRYHSDESIFAFLLSTRAGGLGINLTAADTVILHDLDFNPTTDAQACDRCHRIGQTRPVTVYKLVTKATVDEDIYNLAERKTRMNDAVLGGLKGSDKEDKASVEKLLSQVLDSKATL